ncbi:MAG TPA: alpha-glucuronidase family glycosyl hydrolase [Clostridia bacterium]|nr:alpha-glucuronidase family glycosyl hydrolase [Clostridia bacterium]
MIKNNDKKITGYDAWLGYPALDSAKIKRYVSLFNGIYLSSSDLQLATAKAELKSAVKSMFGKVLRQSETPLAENIIVLCKLDDIEEEPKASDLSYCRDLITDEEKSRIGREGYIIKSYRAASGKGLIIAGKTGTGVIYGVFSLIRQIQKGSFSENAVVIDNPAVNLRMLDHWDNMDGSIERGYSGNSFYFKNNRITGEYSRIRDFARLSASVGINGIVINNVNVHKVETNLITARFLPQVAKIAAIFRQYGIKIYLSANYSSSIDLGGLTTADPLDPEVQSWWAIKADEIYSQIPDFGGFLIKADSEFRPGPFTYGRNHAQGANMLAKALKPYGGLVIWRCFVYNCQQDWRDRITDRANAAYDNFMPLDGSFDDNVLLQIKNGPMDFQVREPVSPLLGGIKKTNVMLELQIAQEYTGQQRHLCYLAPMWKAVLDFDTYSEGKGSTVKSLLCCAGEKGRLSGIAAVSNTGNDMNWTGHDLAQANLYCFGRLSWNPELSSAEIAGEWISSTFGGDPAVQETVRSMLLDSYRIYESYTSPLGIGWMINPAHHYGPSVDGYEYSAWGTYHRSDCGGMGVDRTRASGTGYAGRYFSPNSEMYEKPETCPEELLLFFHHIPYKYLLKSGKTLIQHIYDSHFEGAEQASQLAEKWKLLNGKIEPHCYERVLERLRGQAAHACEWRDVINTYFFRKSGIPDEKGRKIY